LLERLAPDQIFGSDDARTDGLLRKSVRGGMATLSAQASMFGLQMIGTVILARLLSPDDYGLVAMVAVLLTFGGMFKDAGLTMATIQRESINHEQISTLFWINNAIVLVIGLCMLVSAPLLVAFYHRTELTGITAVLALAFVVNGLSIQHDALLKRHMRFGALATEQVVAQALTVGAMIAAAFAGLGYWALVIGTCVTAITTTSISFYLCPWVPDRFRRGTGVRSMLRYGGNVMSFNIVNYFARNSDNILIGRYIGAEGLGLYSKAYSIFLMPLLQVRGPLVDVAMPALSALKDQPDRFRRYYAHLVDSVSTLSVPLAVFSLVEADFLIRVLLGPKWAAVVPVFKILAIAGILQAADGTRGVVLLSQGRSNRHFRWGVINAVALVAAFIAGLQFGIIGVATAYTAANYILLLPSLYYCFAGTPVSPGLFIKALAPSLLCAAPAALAAVVVSSQLGAGSFVGGVVSGIVFIVIYVGLAARRRPVRDNVRMVMTELRSRKRATSDSGPTD
jgi:O-antigen/teichoic acid export membrane protein